MNRNIYLLLINKFFYFCLFLNIDSEEVAKHYQRSCVIFTHFPTKVVFLCNDSPISRFPRWLSGKESICNGGEMGLIPGLGIHPGEGNGNPLQYFCLENPMGIGV